MFSHQRAGRVLGAGALAACLLISHEAGAQTLPVGVPPNLNAAPDRPYRGLFGGSNPDPSQRLELTWSLLGMHDSSDAPESSATDPTLQPSGVFEATSAQLAYSVAKPHFSLNATTSGYGRYYPDLRTLNILNGTADLRIAADVTKKLRLSVLQSAGYQPFYQTDFLTSSAALSSAAAAYRSPADALTSSFAHDYAGRIQATQMLGQRASASIEYDYRRTISSAIPQPATLGTVNGSFLLPLTKYAALHLGYGETQQRSASPGSEDAPILQRTRNIDAGVDYSRPLSPTRKTLFSLRTGSAIITDQGVNYYRILADVTVGREVGRTWTTTLTYHRGVQYVDGFTQPLYADNVKLGLQGLLTRRFDVTTSGGYSNGEIGLSATAAGFTTYTGEADARFALNRTLSLQTQFLYYHYDFAQSPVFIPGLARTLNLEEIRFGVTAWLPVLRR